MRRAQLNSPRYVRGLCFLLLALLLLAVLSLKGLQNSGDDLRYAKALQERSLVDYLAERYTIWSGRAMIDAVTLLVINHVWLWRSLMLLALLLVLGLVAHIAESEQRLLGLIFVFQAFFIMPLDVMDGAVWWMTGSFNYLWPLAAALLALLPFIQPELPSRFLVFVLPATLYGASHEQAGLLLIGFQVLASIKLVRSKEFRWHHGLLMAVALMALVSVVAAPGSLARYHVVTFYWFPEYSEWQLDERIFAGFDLAFSHFFGRKNFISMTLAALLAILVFQRSTSVVKRLLAVVPLLIYVVQATLGRLHDPAARWMGWLVEVLSFQEAPGGYAVQGIGDYETAANSAFYGHFFLLLLGVCCTVVSLWNASIRNRFFNPSTAVIVFLAAILSAAILGLSPTLYASGVRIFFFQDMLVLLLAALVFMQIEGDTFKRMVNVALAFGVLAIVWRLFKNS